MHKRSDIVWPFMLKGYGIDRMMIEVVFLKLGIRVDSLVI